MDANELRALQAPLKKQYREQPATALTPAHAEAILDVDRIACRAHSWGGETDAGLHPATGGDGSLPLGAEQQSLNCVWFRCIGLRDDPADNRGVIVELPGRTAEMGDDGSRKSIGYVVGLVLENASSL